MKRRIPPICMAIVTLVVGVQSWRRRADAQPHQGSNHSAMAAPCPDKQLALANGLEVGQTLGSFEVVEFRCSEQNVMEIVLRRKEVPLVLMVAEPGAIPHSAPRRTSRHDLFYTKRTPQNEPPTQEEIDALLVLLEKRVEAAEKKIGR